MNDNDFYEIKASAFAKMTGLMAPGKDQPIGYHHAYAVRADAWVEWHKEHEEIIDAMKWAFERHMEVLDDSAE